MNWICDMVHFAICQRPDGSFYGTVGRCRKGREVAEAVHLSYLLRKTYGKEPIGKGTFGKVFDIGGGVVVKIGSISENEVQAMEALKHISGISRVISASHDVTSVSSGFPMRVSDHSILGMSKAPGIPVAKLNKNQKKDAWDQALKLLKEIHKQGWAHMDFHEENILYDEKSGRTSIIDFGRAAKGPQMQLRDLRLIASFSLIDEPNNYGPITQKAIRAFKELEPFWDIRSLTSVKKPPDQLIQKHIDNFWTNVISD